MKKAWNGLVGFLKKVGGTLQKVPSTFYKVLAITCPVIGAALVCLSIIGDSAFVCCLGVFIGVGVTTAAFLLMLKTWPVSEKRGQVYFREMAGGSEVWYRQDDEDWTVVQKPDTWKPQTQTVYS